MCNWTRHQIALNYTDSSGQSVRTSLESVAKQTGKSFEALLAKQCDASVEKRHHLPAPTKYPEQLDYLNNVFVELSKSRVWDFNGYPHCITFSEIKAYMEVFQLPLQPWEVAVITQVDEAWVHQRIVEKERRADEEQG